MEVIIIGGVAGGISAATRLRRLDEKAKITIIEKNRCVSYANCGIPYFLGGVIEDQNDLLLTNPKELKAIYNIDVLVESEVYNIDRIKQEVYIKDLGTKLKYPMKYDKLIIATGAKPRECKIKDINKKGVFTLYNINDIERIIDYVKNNNVERIAIIGGDYKGLELAENLKAYDIDITIIEENSQVCENLDKEMANLVHEEIIKNNIQLYLNSKVRQITSEDNELIINLSKDNNVICDLIINTPIFDPESKLAEMADIELGLQKSILVNEYYQTSDSNIYAIGDVIEVYHRLNDFKDVLSSASLAIRQGRLVAGNIAGRRIRESFKVINTTIFKFFSLVIGSVGMNKVKLDKRFIKCQEIYTYPFDHAEFYPNAKQLTTKILFDNYGIIYGFQAIGENSVDKIIDTIATVMQLNGRIQDLEELELSYAPPFSSAKNAINVIGFIAGNLIRGDVKIFTPEDIPFLKKESIQFVDVRSNSSFKEHTIENAIALPYELVREKHGMLTKSKPVYVFCETGFLSYLAACILTQNGYNTYFLTGGMRMYGKYKMKF